jgi:glycosyltransferase involved in cell wall biosynthesis
LEVQKDFNTLITAFAVLRRSRHAKLVILGEGSLRDKLEAQAFRLGVADDILMPGFQSNPYAWYATADVFVLSSVHEGFGNVLVEAMACGTPVVSTDCPSGPAEILENGRYGRLVPVSDPISLAKAIKEQLDAVQDLNLVRARAREFSVEAAVDAYIKLIHEIVSESYT